MFPDNVLVAVPIGFQLLLFPSEETRPCLSTNKFGGGNEDEASLDNNMSQWTMTALGTLGREMIEIKILAGAETI
jgi:hypothetical protein